MRMWLAGQPRPRIFSHQSGQALLSSSHPPPRVVPARGGSPGDAVEKAGGSQDPVLRTLALRRVHL